LKYVYVLFYTTLNSDDYTHDMSVEVKVCLSPISTYKLLSCNETRLNASQLHDGWLFA